MLDKDEKEEPSDNSEGDFFPLTPPLLPLQPRGHHEYDEERKEDVDIEQQASIEKSVYDKFTRKYLSRAYRAGSKEVPFGFVLTARPVTYG